MTAVAKPKPAAPAAPLGPLDWRRLVEWLSHDGVISAEEAQRTVARCSQAESAQHPLVRLAAVAMQRASDGKPLDIEMLTQWLAGDVVKSIYQSPLVRGADPPTGSR